MAKEFTGQLGVAVTTGSAAASHVALDSSSPYQPMISGDTLFASSAIGAAKGNRGDKTVPAGRATSNGTPYRNLR
jgi:hypothetical protein